MMAKERFHVSKDDMYSIAGNQHICADLQDWMSQSVCSQQQLRNSKASLLKMKQLSVYGLKKIQLVIIKLSVISVPKIQNKVTCLDLCTHS